MGTKKSTASTTLELVGKNEDTGEIAIEDVEITASETTTDKLFDLEELRIDQDYEELAGTEQVLVDLEVRKPRDTEFVRVHPKHQLGVGLITIEGSGVYLVHASMREALAAEIKPKILCLAVTQHGTPFLWPVPPPAMSGRENSYNVSQRQAAELARTTWTRMATDQKARTYKTYKVTAKWPEPKWPDQTFTELLNLAFKGNVINSKDHPVFRRLFGLE
jgi:hypothetical protein